MQISEIDIREKIRRQFDTGPYPRIPLEKSPKQDAMALYVHSSVNPYYLRNQKVAEIEGKLILDAGCGTGYKSLILAEANPGAKIIGVDLSEKSVELARQRLQYHGFDHTEFHAISIEELPHLGLRFDYINCDDVLYLFPEPATGLQAMKAVLQPDGIIRANLHSSLQRTPFYRAQEIFRLMGLMEGNPAELEIDLVREIMQSLSDPVKLKAMTWKPEFNEEQILANYLLQGDKGSTIPELFSALRAADLEFISMVNWWQWVLPELFKQPDNLPSFLAMSLPETSVEEQLHLFELLHSVHRLLDFWCGHPDRSQASIPVAEWTLAEWQSAQVHLLPQLRTLEVKQELISCISQMKPFEVSQHLLIRDTALIDATTAACLLPLWEESQSLKSLMQRWQHLRPVHPVTLELTTEEESLDLLIRALTTLVNLGYVLVERNQTTN